MITYRLFVAVVCLLFVILLEKIKLELKKGKSQVYG